MVDDRLSIEQRLLVQVVRQVVEKYGVQYWRRLDRDRLYPEEFVDELNKLGFAAPSIPKTYGGAGLGVKEASLILEEINSGGGNAQPFHGQYYLSFMVSRFANESLKLKYLPLIASGKLRMQSFALTEAEAGSDSTRVKTYAEKRGDKYIINGHKIWISRVKQSDLMVLVARTTPYEEVSKKTEGISLFLIELGRTQGIEAREITTMFNSQTYELQLENVELPRENLIGEEGKGFKYVLDVLNPERILIASECIGDARWFIDKAVEYAKNRVVFGKPLGSNQGVQFPLADTYSRLLAADELRWKAAELFDSDGNDENVGLYANTAKYLAAECSWKAANLAMDVFGGSGLAVDNDVERKFRETRLFQVAPISQNLVLSYISHHVLGLPRSY
jgi:acyl-CoA dehydrogenase